MATKKRFMTPLFRVSYANVFKAVENKNGKLKYSLSAIWTPKNFSPKDKKLWKAIMAEMDSLSQEKFGKPWKSLPAAVYKKGIRDGEEKEGTKGYGPGTVFANLSSDYRPGIIDRDREEISVEMGNEEAFYSGCYARATINLYAFDNVSKGIGLGLNNLMKVKDGEPLSARTEAKDDFGDFEEDYEDDGEEDDSPF